MRGGTNVDSITHLLLGHVMGALTKGHTPAAQTGAYWGALVGNSLPDIDVPIGFLLGRGWGLHRTFTHTAPGIIGLSMVTAAIITWLIPGSSIGLTLVWLLAGSVVHIFLDCLNLFGTRPFSPWSDRVIAVGVLFILDPVIVIGLSAATLIHALGWLKVPGLWTIYLLMWLYIGARWFIKLRIERRLHIPGTIQSVVAPWFATWRYFRQSESIVEYGRVRSFGAMLESIETVVPAQGLAVDVSRTVPAVAGFLRRARFPFAEVRQHENHVHVLWQDLFMRMRGGRSGVEVVLDQNLQLL
jgi:inner membrane protein